MSKPGSKANAETKDQRPKTKRPKKPKAEKVYKTTSQRAWESADCRCFYCRSLLVITDTSLNYAVCSADCPSKIVVVTASQKCRIRRAWVWEKAVTFSKSISKESINVGVKDSDR